MKTLIKNLLINNWPRKCLSIILAIIIWFVVNKSLTTTRTLNNVCVKIENIPPGKTVEGIQSNGLLNRKINLTLSGNKGILDELDPNDLQVVFDATGKEGEWIASITRKNLRTDNPDINLSQGISRISQQNFIIKLSKLVSEKIPIIITQPIGEPPPGYEFIDIWPYQLSINVSGPEDEVKKLKNVGLNLTFNLNDITKTNLDELKATSTKKHSDVISFYVPNAWKRVSIPFPVPTSTEINDPDARFLRIDFLCCELLKLNSPIPVSLYFPPNENATITPSKIHLAPHSLIEQRNGIKMVTETLYAKRVSALFLDVIKDRLELAIIVSPKNEEKLDWSVQFINAKALEELYVRFIQSDTPNNESRELYPHMREHYLRNRFRNYMNRFQLYRSENELFELSPQLVGNTIIVNEVRADEP